MMSINEGYNDDGNREGQDFLHVFAQELCARRKEAVNRRKAAGLDGIWKKAREQYQGIDEMNRVGYSKSTTLDGPITTNMAPRGKEKRSTVFVNITRPYTNAGTARVSDIYLPTGKMPWALKPTPISDMSELKEALAEYPEIMSGLAMLPEFQTDLATDEAAAAAAIEAAGVYIKDWLKENKWTAEVRALIKETGVVGTGIIKGPFPKKKRISEKVERVLSILPSDAEERLRMQLERMPVSDCVKVENFYPDPNCGNNIHNGGFIFEKVPDTARRELRELMEDETYFAEQIQLCLDEGAMDMDGKPRDKAGESKKPFDLWIYQGDVDMRALTAEEDEERGEDTDTAPGAIAFGTAIMCNDKVIKVAPYYLEKDEFIYDVVVWEPREGSWAGVGVPEQIETPQRGLNAAVRALMDNMGYSVGPQVIEMKGLITPVDGNPEMTPYKRWIATVDGVTTTIDDVKKAITFLEFPNYLKELMPVVQYWLKMAEDTTSLPLLLQGQSTTDAVGVSQQLQNNATTNLRLIVKELDDRMTVPQVSRYYEWAQLFGPERVKGDAAVEALGSSVLITRELQQQALMQVMDRFVQPIYGKSPKKGMDAFLEGHQLDPEKFDLTDEEKETLQAAQDAPDPAVQVAEIRGRTDVQVAEIRASVDREKLAQKGDEEMLKADVSRDAAETNAASNVATEELRQEGAMDRELVKGENGGNGKGERDEEEGTPMVSPAEVPNVEDMEMDVDGALQAMGFVD